MIWLLSFILISLAMAGLAVGVLFGRKPLKGSCGGLNNFDPGAGCDLCGGNQQKCQELGNET
jgi:hypothetical protein